MKYHVKGSGRTWWVENDNNEFYYVVDSSTPWVFPSKEQAETMAWIQSKLKNVKFFSKKGAEVND